MGSRIHNLADLFQQLGLPSDNSSMERFVQRHRPIEKDELPPDSVDACERAGVRGQRRRTGLAE